jgi:hypothetical protein
VALYNEFRKEVENIAAKYFNDKGYKVQIKRPYILDKRENWSYNIILPEVADFIKKQAENSKKDNIPFPLHKYLHHGLSSQALLFNLFGEFVKDNDYEILSKILTNTNRNYKKIQFEYYDRNVFNEITGQPTSFDLAIIGEQPIFIEAKFVEQKFGTCSIFEKGDCDGLNPIKQYDLCYLNIISRKYLQLLKKHNLDDPYINDNICPLSIYYQFYREIIFAKEKNGYYCFVYDKRNPVFINNNRGIFKILYDRLPNELKEIVILKSYQEIIKEMEQYNIKWLNEFKIKYGV